MIKKIFIYWGQKFINAPDIVKKCLLSWKLENPTWDIIELDDDNLLNIKAGMLSTIYNKKHIKIPKPRIFEVWFGPIPAVVAS